MEAPTPTSFGAAVRAARIAKGWSQTQLSRASGINSNQIARLEVEDRDIRWSTACRLAWALDLSLDAVALLTRPGLQMTEYLASKEVAQEAEEERIAQRMLARLYPEIKKMIDEKFPGGGEDGA